MHIQRLFIYPIKSLLPIELKSAKITDAGFEYDRAFVLIKDIKAAENGISEHLTIKTTSQLCLFRQSIDEEKTILTVTFAPNSNPKESIKIPLQPDTAELASSSTYTVNMFGTEARGVDMGAEIASFFSKHLDQPARLIYIGRDGTRAVPAPSLIPRKPARFPWLMKDEVHTQQIRFNDAAPFLITTTASEEETRARLPKEYQDEDILIRFRTNIHVDVSEDAGFKPYEEDDWKKLSINSQTSSVQVDLDVVFRTPRCQSLNVDFETGGLLPTDRQLFKLLTKDRRINPAFSMKPCFGVYAFAAPSGTILSVGDEVAVSEKQA